MHASPHNRGRHPHSTRHIIHQPDRLRQHLHRPLAIFLSESLHRVSWADPSRIQVPAYPRHHPHRPRRFHPGDKGSRSRPRGHPPPMVVESPLDARLCLPDDNGIQGRSAGWYVIWQDKIRLMKPRDLHLATCTIVSDSIRFIISFLKKFPKLGKYLSHCMPLLKTECFRLIFSQFLGGITRSFLIATRANQWRLCSMLPKH